MMKNKAFRGIFCVITASLCLISTTLFDASAASDERSAVRYENPNTGFQIMILDDIDLLSDAEETALVEDMKPITEYGDIIFWSTDRHAQDEIIQAQEKRYDLYGDESAGIFAVNTGNRKVVFQSDGRIYELVTSSLARSITDNVSHYASSGDYYSCAAEAYAQIEQVLEGNRIAEPMKYISYAVIALMLSFVIVVGIVFGRLFNPLARKTEEQAKLVGTGSLFTSAPSIVKTKTEPRAWVVIIGEVLLQTISKSGGSRHRGSGGSQSRGGGHRGGGGGGSSSY